MGSTSPCFFFTPTTQYTSTPVSTRLRRLPFLPPSSICASSPRGTSFDSTLSTSTDSAAFDVPRIVCRISSSVVFLIGLGFFSLSFPLGYAQASNLTKPAAASASQRQDGSVQEEDCVQEDEGGRLTTPESLEDEELEKAFEKWKTKTYALTVPLRIISLQGSLPPSWLKDFVQSQEKRAKISLEVRGSLETIFSGLLDAFSKAKVNSKSAVAADLVTIGDSWLNIAVKKGLIEPMQIAENEDWLNGLGDRWKVHLRRNSEGVMDPNGKVWAVPYRWGSMVIMYKKSKFKKHGLAPIEDWADLWRPDLAGKISMVDSPREVIGAVLKHLGASYNLNDLDSEVTGGISSVKQSLAVLTKQVRLFDSTQYLKAFAVGDVWVAVGWSSDILPAAKRSSDVAVVVPKSGASLWADLWGVPAATSIATDKIGGRIRGPSPLIDQWLDFCLQPAREIPFKQGVVPGASPSSLEHAVSGELLKELTKGAPQLDTNLVAGIPPPEILDKCEFLEPLLEETLAQYKLLLSDMQKSNHGLAQKTISDIATAISAACTRVVKP